MYGKCATLVEDGMRSVTLKRTRLWDDKPDGDFPDIWRYRVLCPVENCMGELHALDTDRYAGVAPQGGVVVVRTDDGHLQITTLYFPPVYVERETTPGDTLPRIIEHIKRDRPRAPSLYSAAARAQRLRSHGSPATSDGQLWPEFDERIFDIYGNRISVSYDLTGFDLPKRFRCPLCETISFIGQEVVADARQ